MIIKILLNYIFGYVNINIEGYFIERFINMCRSKSILLWKMKRKSSSTLSANISIQDFKRVKSICKKTKCRVEIEDKKGFPFLFHKYKKRKLFFLFLIIIVASLLITSSFVWNIDITGTQEISKEEIIKDLEENGLTIGKFRARINTKNIINNIRLKRDDIAWIGIKIQGTNAKVEIVESYKKPEIIDESEYCNIISEKEGIIVKIDAKDGTSLVQPGDVVKKGTILIGGWLEGKYTGTRYVHAKGEVEAKIWYSEKVKINRTEEISVRTGELENKYGIKINNFEINFYKRLSIFENYDTINEKKKIKLFSDFYLPIEIVKTTNYQTTPKVTNYTTQEAKQMGETIAKKKIEEQIQDKQNIVNETVNTYEYDDYVEVEVIYEVLEMIGTKEKIVF